MPREGIPYPYSFTMCSMYYQLDQLGINGELSLVEVGINGESSLVEVIYYSLLKVQVMPREGDSLSLLFHYVFHVSALFVFDAHQELFLKNCFFHSELFTPYEMSHYSRRKKKPD